MYNIVGKFIKKTIPIKCATITIIKGYNNPVSTPKPPYVVLQIIDENRIYTTETRYTNKHKILWARSEITMNMSFVEADNIAAIQMAKSFVVRFNDAWASVQFAQYSDIFFPIYCKDV